MFCHVLISFDLSSASSALCRDLPKNNYRTLYLPLLLPWWLIVAKLLQKTNRTFLSDHYLIIDLLHDL